MQKNKMAGYFIVLAIIFTVSLGCKFLKPDNNREITKEPKSTEITEEPNTTEITKDVLKERLGAKGIKTARFIPNGKPNPLTLHLKFSNHNNNFLLNRESYENFGALANKLREIFRQREDNGVFIEGTNEVYKKITLPVYEKDVADYKSKNITVEDFEKLVDDLQKEDFDQIELNLDEENLQLIENVRTRGGGEVSDKEPKDSESDPNST
ncbi:MAG: hypothetical protein ABIP06_09285, partial [Pyrinomonadaceae bacterium]